MDADDMDSETYNSLPETQERIEPTPSPPDPVRDAALWGYLQRYPGDAFVPWERYDLRRDCPVVTFGRHPKNTISLSHDLTCSLHATLRWVGVQNGVSVVTFEDHSGNGSYVEGTKLLKSSRTLRNKEEISFGSPQAPPPGNTSIKDFRFIYHDLASPPRGVLERYELGEIAGRGTFATVYKAYDKKDGKIFAVKAIHRHKSLKLQTNTEGETVNPQHLLVRREIDAMTKLRHPNISCLVDHFWNADGSIDLVVDWMAGGDLHGFIQQHNGLSERMTKYLMRQLCEALAFVHGNDIAHRDLKPENILLTTDRPPILKIADFGLAKLVDYETRLTSICGTPMYLAPEFRLHMIHGTGYGKELDVFAAGGSMYNCIAFCRALYSDMPEGRFLLEHAREKPDREVDYRTIEEHVISVDREGYPVYLSTHGRHFLRGLMESDPVKRLTMVQALAHPWFTFDQADSYTPPAAAEPTDECDALASSFQDVVMHTRPATGGATTATPTAGNVSAAPTVANEDDEIAPGLPSLVKNPRMLERQRDVLERARSQQQLFAPPPELLRDALKLLPAASAPNLDLGGTAACVTFTNKRKYEVDGGNTDMRRTMSPERGNDLPVEPALKRGKSEHGVDADAMDVSPKKRERGGRGRGR
ncbi:kinase-like domain-containing protein [Mycena filopes]|nr:kinase-like domain-containing protein [Mycena filopes]